MADPLLEFDDVTIQYQTNQGPLTAVSNASFTVDQGEYFGLVGESGCGKSTIANAILGGLDDNGEVTSGTISFKGREIQDLSERELREEIRWKEISWIPQGSMNSLNPLERIDDQAIEIARTHTDLTRTEAGQKLEEMFEIVGLDPDRVSDYPFEFSGGMQQRVLISFALFLEPSFIIADEPTTALDVIMQDEVFKYLDTIKDGKIGLVLITHDISLVFESCDDMAVMHAGQICETGPVTDVFDAPRHPYSILLQRAFPDVRFPDRDLVSIDGNPPENFGAVDYCSFVDRCPWAVDACREAEPPLESVPDGSSDHLAACVRQDEQLRADVDAPHAADGGSHEQ